MALTRTPRFAVRLFTAGERAYCEARVNPAQHYAARFCAKEAFAKALGVPLAWQQVEIRREAGAAPTLHASGHAAEQLAGRRVQLSISHAGDYALAVVLIEEAL